MSQEKTGKEQNMNMKYQSSTGIVAILLCAMLSTTQAAELDTMFDEIGAYGNVTGPAAYNAQSANIYSGGSLYMRTPIRNYQLVSVEAPYLRMGCGGIDLHAGSFSFINKDALTAMFKNIGSNAIGYSFVLALGTICPDCKNGIQWMNQIAAEVNKFNINSCEAAKGLMPRNIKDTISTTQATLAESWGRISNAYTDQNDSKQNIGGDDLKKRDQLVNMRATDPRLKAVDPKGNIVWRALKNMPDLTDEQRLLFMNFIGTVIITENPTDGSMNPQYYAPTKITLQDVLGVPGQPLTQVQGYSCFDNLTDCEQLAPNIPLTLADSSIRYRVNTVVWDFVAAIQGNTAPQASSISFLGSTPLPLYKMISVALMTGNYMTILRDTVEITSMEIASSYINYVADTLDKMLANHKVMSDSATSALVDKLAKNVEGLRKQVFEAKMIAYNEVKNTYVMTDKIKMFERDLLASVPSRLGKSITATARQ